MIRIRAIVEGPTEERFIKDIIQPHLSTIKIHIDATITGYKKRMGGDVRYSRVKDHIIKTLKEDRNIICTTFYDFYGLGQDFPRLDEAKRGKNIREKQSILREVVKEDVVSEMGKFFDSKRILPYIQMYEFEALLFSDCVALAKAIGHDESRKEFQKIRDQFSTPEEINDNKQTSPSHRILGIYGRYSKVQDGSLAILKTGLDCIRRECPLFDEWMMQLESFAF